MDRQRQDLLTWILGAVILLSQLVPFIPHRPELIVVASGLVGLPSIRKIQENVKNGVS